MPETEAAQPISAAVVHFCGEVHPVPLDRGLVVGRQADISVDENPYLHRHFLKVSNHDGLWLLTNIGSSLTATVSDDHGLLQAWLGPGAQLPLLSATTVVWFTAGPTTYELEILVPAQGPPAPAHTQRPRGGDTTLSGVPLTRDQKLLILALTERALRRGDRGSTSIPSSKSAADRLRWPLTKFNRKLDNVCQKLASMGVRGLHGDSTHLAANRRTRLAEYALATRLVTREDLTLLDLSSNLEGLSTGGSPYDSA